MRRARTLRSHGVYGPAPWRHQLACPGDITIAAEHERAPRPSEPAARTRILGCRKSKSL